MNFAHRLFRPGTMLLAFALAVPTSAFSASRGKVYKVPTEIVRDVPYKFCGSIITTLDGDTKNATGAVVFPGVVLTAAEVTWSPQAGFATKVEFQRGRDLGTVKEVRRATYIILLKRFTTTTDDFTKFYTNIAGLIFGKDFAGGRGPSVRAGGSQMEGLFGHFIVGYNSNPDTNRQMFDYFAQFKKVEKLMFQLSPSSDSSSPTSYSGVSSVPGASKGAPVFYESEPGIASSASIVGIMVSTTLARGISQREIDLFYPTATSSTSTAP